jgi:hypothetical protein
MTETRHDRAVTGADSRMPLGAAFQRILATPSITGFTSTAEAAGECLAERSRPSRCAVPCAGCLNSLAIAWGPAAVVQYLSAGTIASRAEIVSAG